MEKIRLVGNETVFFSGKLGNVCCDISPIHPDRVSATEGPSDASQCAWTLGPSVGVPEAT